MSTDPRDLNQMLFKRLAELEDDLSLAFEPKILPAEFDKSCATVQALMLLKMVQPRLGAMISKYICTESASDVSSVVFIFSLEERKRMSVIRYSLCSEVYGVEKPELIEWSAVYGPGLLVRPISRFAFAPGRWSPHFRCRSICGRIVKTARSLLDK